MGMLAACLMACLSTTRTRARNKAHSRPGLAMRPNAPRGSKPSCSRSRLAAFDSKAAPQPYSEGCSFFEIIIPGCQEQPCLRRSHIAAAVPYSKVSFFRGQPYSEGRCARAPRTAHRAPRTAHTPLVFQNKNQGCVEERPSSRQRCSVFC